MSLSTRDILKPYPDSLQKLDSKDPELEIEEDEEEEDEEVDITPLLERIAFALERIAENTSK